ncbi:MAG: hypothetical protein LBI14_08750 [Treponema sp.]|jgi:hypothetical protein|nr:hypothetical protein [Treponema sp.]
MRKFFLFGVFLSFLMFSACGSEPASSTNSGASAADAIAAAQAALNRMDGGQPTQVAPSQQQSAAGQSGSTQQSAVPTNTSRTQPAWVDSVDSVFTRAQYVAAVGYASDRAMAERNDLANLAAIFGQSIQADMTITNTYWEAVRNGVSSGWTDTTEMDNTIKLSTAMGTLVGAETKEVWFDSRSTYYAVVAMEKTRTAQVYTEMIKANQNMIGNLLAMSQEEKNTLEGFSRYQFAATVADINISYGNLLQLIGVPFSGELPMGDTYRLEAQNIARAIPIRVTVTNDRSGRIQNAFAGSLSALGFRSGGTASRYVLEVDVTTTEVEYPNNTNKWTRMELSAILTDSNLGLILLPYSFNTREGHITYAEAVNRAYTAAERGISEEYKDLLSNFLSKLLQKD